LVIDLDGTLSNRDFLHSAIFKFLFTNPWRLLELVTHALKGPAELKQYLVNKVAIDISHMPWNSDLVDFLKTESENGRRIVLCSGSHEKWVAEAASHFSFFSESFGTTKSKNLTGRNKAAFLTEKFGKKGFDYIGDSKKDLELVEFAESIVILKPDSNTLVMKLRSIFSALRPKHWLKNTLIFLPALAAHTIAVPEVAAALVGLFLIFSMLISGTYILNDLADIDIDSRHPVKRNRAIVSGRLGIFHAATVAAILISLSVYLSFLLFDASLGLTIVAYLVLTTAYSFKLKQIHGLDILSILILFQLRITAGTIAAEVPFSFWLMAVAFFTFASLATVKRFIEVRDSRESKIVGRGYQKVDMDTLKSLGIGAGLLANLVLGLYLNSPKVVTAYSNPFVLWPIVPIFFFWVSHLWFSVDRKKIESDPVEWAISDKTSLLCVASVLLLAFLAL
jgi:4-hydroxybenzoate polyprenyltransferase/phosphoserine phosphatase